MTPRKYDSTVARIAGNLLSGCVPSGALEREQLANFAVALARAIVAATKRTEPAKEP
jgi:hypothetical protein